MSNHNVSRRAWIKGATLASTAAATLVAARGDLLAAAHDAPRLDGATATPDEVLDALMAGNRRFAAGMATGPHRSLARLAQTAAGQSPIAAVLGCADSRVPAELIFDQGLGDLFVTRVAGNVATPEDIASLEYGTEVLGARLLVVLGHTDCGAIKAAAQGGPQPGQISSLFQYMRPAVQAAGGDVATAVTANVRFQADILASASPVIAARLQSGMLKVVGGVYDVGSGRVGLLERSDTPR